MNDLQPIGDFIRERRLALGFSAGQLAMRLGSTAAIVRSWERGTADVPDDVLVGLADLLDVAPEELEELAAATAAPDETDQVEEPASESDDVDADDEAASAGDTDAESETVEEAAQADEVVAAETDPVIEDDAETEDLPETEAGGDAGEPAGGGAVGHMPGLGVDDPILDAPTEAFEPVRAPVATVTRPRPGVPLDDGGNGSVLVEPAATEVDGSIPDWLGPIRFLLDPDARYVYWLRWAGTFLGLLILWRVLGWSIGELFSALGDFWDSFRSIEPAEEEFVSLGPLAWFG